MKGKEPKSSAEILSAALEKSGRRELDPEARRKLLAFIEELLGWGKRVHLVGKGSLGLNLETQVLDSILLMEAARALLSALKGSAGDGALAGRIADIGSGGGFPGIVWSILLPGASVTLFERRIKQQAFLDRTISLLGLPGVQVVGEDASRFAGARSFDFVTSKAAGRIAEMAPIAAMLLRDGGLYVTIKGGGWEDELEAVAGTGLRFLDAIQLPFARGQAVILEKCEQE